MFLNRKLGGNILKGMILILIVAVCMFINICASIKIKAIKKALPALPVGVAISAAQYKAYMKKKNEITKIALIQRME